MPPAAIGPFQIQGELGRGGMGEVYLARDTRLECVDGETLERRLASGAIPVDEALALAKQITEALEAAHEKGVIHRDLKPVNVMVTPDGVVKVLDFGLARTAEGPPSTTGSRGGADSPTLPIPSPTIPGAIMGTAGYMSPEQARGKSVDKRSDIVSFGCVLYEMLSGEGPAPADAISRAFGPTGSCVSCAELGDPGMLAGVRLVRWAIFGAAMAVAVAGAILMVRDGDARLPDPPEPGLSGETDPGSAARMRSAVAAVRADRADRARWIELAMVYQAHGLYALARPCYETALRMDDDDAVAWYHLSTIRAHDGDVAGAIEAIRRSIAADGTYAPAHRHLGEWLLDLDDQAGALASFERARDLLPADPASHVGIARVALRTGDTERAAAILRESGADSGAALHLQAALARRLGRADDAVALAARAARATGRPIDPWADALGRFNATIEAQLDRVRALAEAGLTDAALRLLHDLARTYADHAGVHNAAGIVLFQAGRHADAHAAFTRAVAAADEFAEAHANLAQTSVALADAGAPPAQRDALIAAAERHVARAIELAPASAAALALDADLLHRRGLDGAAVERYREALALMPAPPWALAAGRILVETGALAGALPLLESAARDMPGSVEARLALAEACAGLGRGAEASALIGEAMQQWPDDPRPRDLARRLGLEDRE